MHRTAIITDSTSNLPEDLREQYDIRFAPLSVIWETGEAMRDGIDITAEAFYQRLRAGGYPTTSQPVPAAFGALYEAAQAAGAEAIVVLTIAHALSGTYDSAMQAKEGFDLPVYVMDSRSTSLGLGWQVLAAARARAAGSDAAGMLAAAEAARARMRFIISLDTLEYLHRGGRIGGAARFLGSMLNLKPQIYVDHDTGCVEAGARTRTRKRAIQALYDEFFTQVEAKTAGPLRVCVLHADALADAEALAARVQADYAPDEMLIAEVTPVLGVHVGPGAVALAGYTEALS